MHLISVDLPAPLSPTSAITSPSFTSKSTSVSACTEPNDLERPRSWRSGDGSLILAEFLRMTVEAPRRAPPPPYEPVTCSTSCTRRRTRRSSEELVLEDPRVVGLREH